MAPIFFRILLALVVVYALTRGSRDERHVGLICVFGTLLTHLLLSPLTDRFDGVESQVMAVDLAVFAGFVVVALRSERFWPLWVAGLQLTTLLGHLLKGVDTDLFPRAYGAALTFWSYPILIILAVGTWRSSRIRAMESNSAPA